VNKTARKEEGTSQQSQEDCGSSCVLLDSMGSCVLLDYNSSCVLLDSMGSCVVLDDHSIVLETVMDDSSYRWHGSSCVLLVDCRVASGLPEEDIMKDTSLAKREC
jgi:hypothetical protein